MSANAVTLKVFDASGSVVAESKKTFNYKRSSMEAAAHHKALDAMWRPGVVAAVIEIPINEKAAAMFGAAYIAPKPIKFKFVDGRSVVVFN